MLKKSNLFNLAILAFMILAFSSCEKNENAEGPVFQARLVASFCAYNIVEIQEPALFGWGMEWKNPQGNTLRHVFAVSNPCDFNNTGIKPGDVFRCRVIEKPIASGCAVCMGYMETPPLSYNIEVIR